MEIPIAMECSSTRSRCAGRGTGRPNVQRDVPRLVALYKDGHAQARRARVAHDRARRHQRRVQGDGGGRGRPIGRRLRDLNALASRTCATAASGHSDLVVSEVGFGTLDTRHRLVGPHRRPARDDHAPRSTRASTSSTPRRCTATTVSARRSSPTTSRRSATTSSSPPRCGYDINAERKFPGQSERPHDWRPGIGAPAGRGRRCSGSAPTTSTSPAAQHPHRADRRRHALLELDCAAFRTRAERLAGAPRLGDPAGHDEHRAVRLAVLGGWRVRLRMRIRRTGPPHARGPRSTTDRRARRRTVSSDRGNREDTAARLSHAPTRRGAPPRAPPQRRPVLRGATPGHTPGFT